MTENVSDDLPQLLGECQDSSKVNLELEQTEAVSNKKMRFGRKHKCHEFENMMREIDKRSEDLEAKTPKPQLNERIEGSKDLEVKTPESQLNVTIITIDSQQRIDSSFCNTGREFPQSFSTRQITRSHPNSLPTAYRMVQDGKMNLHNLTTQIISGPESQTCVLQVTELLKGIVQRNIVNIIRNNIRRCLKEVSDLPVDFLIIAEERDKFCIDLIISTDGVTFVNSSTSHQMYPVWLAVAQLPPILRNSKKNIALAALFVGKGKPNWKKIVRILKQELKQVVTVTMSNSKNYFLKFNDVLL